MLKRIVLVVAFIAAFSLGGVANAQTVKECTPFGCHPAQGNPIQELGGMIVACGVVTVLLAGAARRYVK